MPVYPDLKTTGSPWAPAATNKTNRNKQNALHVNPIAFGVSFPESQVSINNLVVEVSFATFR